MNLQGANLSRKFFKCGSRIIQGQGFTQVHVNTELWSNIYTRFQMHLCAGANFSNKSYSDKWNFILVKIITCRCIMLSMCNFALPLVANVQDSFVKVQSINFSKRKCMCE